MSLFVANRESGIPKLINAVFMKHYTRGLRFDRTRANCSNDYRSSFTSDIALDGFVTLNRRIGKFGS